jgi:hypothetical protein
LEIQNTNVFSDFGTLQVKLALMGLGPIKVMKNAFYPATALDGSVALPFVIPSPPGFPVRCTKESSMCGFL